MPQDMEISKRRMATINERIRVIQLHAEGKAIALLQKVQAFQNLRPKELLSIGVILAKLNPQ
jgi:hypothetical protein